MSYPYFEYEDENIRNIKVSHIEDYLVILSLNNSNFILETVFNYNTKQFIFTFLKNDTNIFSSIKFCIGPRNKKNAFSKYWEADERPNLYSIFSEVNNIEKLCNIDIKLIKFIIIETLSECKTRNYIQFDTSKDIRRQISLILNKKWYPFPG
jgi:hypothetical protein